MNKKVVVFGGGTGLSTLLSGLKLYPIDITAIVSVCDDGKSTGKLREEFHIPAVGDIRKVLISLSEDEPLIKELLDYRFKTSSDLDGHAVGNLLLAATTNMNGSVSKGIESLSKIFKLKGKILPLTDENITLKALMDDGNIVTGEHNITQDKRKISKVFYDKSPKANKDAIKAIKDADLIVLSMGSLFTSILPNLICDDIIKAIDNSDAKILYICNMMTQPGETDNFGVSDHIKIINDYLGNRKINAVIANNGKISNKIVKKYETSEQKNPVPIDIKTSKNIDVIEDNLVIINDEVNRHDFILLGYHVFSYLLKM